VAEHDLEAELLAEHPTWAPTPVAQPTSVDEPTLGPHDAGLARRIHASIAEAFPDTSSTIRDRRRHALSILATRKRPDGPIASSAELDLEEQLRLSNLLERIKAGTATVTDAPDGTVEIRGAGGGWNYAVTLEPPAVTSWQGEPPGAEGGSGVPTPGELPLKGST
jgi:hypothetical protein